MRNKKERERESQAKNAGDHTHVCSHMTWVEKEIPILQKDEAEAWNAEDETHAQKPKSSHNCPGAVELND